MIYWFWSILIRGKRCIHEQFNGLLAAIHITDVRPRHGIYTSMQKIVLKYGIVQRNLITPLIHLFIYHHYLITLLFHPATLQPPTMLFSLRAASLPSYATSAFQSTPRPTSCPTLTALRPLCPALPQDHPTSHPPLPQR